MSKSTKKIGVQVPDIDALIAQLEHASEVVESVGEDRVRRTREVYNPLSRRLDEYEEEATGLGDFESYVELQSVLAELEEEASENDVYRVDDIEEAVSRFERTTLREKEFRRAREDLSEIERVVTALDDMEGAIDSLKSARGRLKNRRKELRRRLRELESKIETARESQGIDPSELEELVETYNSRLENEFDDFVREAPVTDVLELGLEMKDLPLVDSTPLDSTDVEYLKSSELSDSTVSEVLEYSDYSDAKLSHYVDNPGEFRSAVPKTWFKTLDSEPLKLSYEDSEGTVKHKAPELMRTVEEFASEETVSLLRRVHAMAERGEYGPMRRAHLADKETGGMDLGDLEQKKEEVEAEIEEIEREVEKIGAALED